MEALLAFYFGWTMGARAGAEGVEELNSALASLRQSEEFAALLAALRKQGAFLLREVAGRVEGPDAGVGLPDVLARVYELIFPARSDPAPG